MHDNSPPEKSILLSQILFDTKKVMKYASESLAQKILAGERISSEEALFLYEHESLLQLGVLANFRRQAAVPGSTVTFLIDRNINYTNVCNTDCTFCGFYRPTPEHPEAYTLSKDELQHKIEEALALGATRILLQGGHNESLPYEFYVDMISWIHQKFPIEINAFSPSEIHQMQLVSDKSYEEILRELKAAGMKGLPGGGAELLVDSIRKRVSPKKISARRWLDIMGVAHSLDLTTTATMVIGFGEPLSERVAHLDAVRQQQDVAQAAGKEGFNAFISWGLQHNENTSMGRSRHSGNYGANGQAYLRNLAISRIFLDSIPHHASSWPTYGTDIGQMALHFGADDFGSTMMEENVVSKAGALTQSKWEMSPEELICAIEGAGFEAAQRNSSYERVHTDKLAA